MPDPTFAERLETMWNDAAHLWSAGGWAMWGIGAIALSMFALGVHIRMRLSETGFLSVPESIWRRWIDRPEEREGPIGAILDFVLGAESDDDHALGSRFHELRATETAPFERDLRVMKVCVSAAPLVGLLGTVTGMLSTFGALASGSGGEKTMALIAKGISEALITTETGLVVALPGLFFQYSLARRFDRFREFLAHVETVCTQSAHRDGRERERAETRREAAAAIAKALRAHLTAQRAVS